MLNLRKQDKSTYIVNAMGMHSTKYGGLERFLVQLATDLNDIDVKLILIYNSKPLSEKFLSDYYNAGGELIVSHAMRPLSFLYDFLKIFFKYKPILVHAHFQFYYTVIFAKMLGCKHVLTTFHTMLIDDTSSLLKDSKQMHVSTRVARLLLHRLTNKIFTVSDASRDHYLTIYPEMKKKVQKFYLGSPPNSFGHLFAREKYHIPEDKIAIGTIGFNSPIKGLDLLFDAIVVLKNQFGSSGFILYQIGININAPENDHYKLECAEKGITDEVCWMGIRDDIREILPGLDIYCQPSRSESLPLAIIEAGMAGLPIVASNVGGISEIVKDRYNGYLFEKENVTSLAMHLLKLISNNRLRRNLGGNSLKHMMTNFNIFSQSKEMVKIYTDEIHK